MATPVYSNIPSYGGDPRQKGSRIVTAGSKIDVDVPRWMANELDPWETALRPLNDEWDKLWEKWWIKPLQKTDTPFLSRVQSSYGHRLVETLVPTILGENPKITYVNSQFEEDDLPAALNTALAKAQLKRMRFDHHARDYIRQGVIKGYTIGKVGWIQEKAHLKVDQTETHRHAGEDFQITLAQPQMVTIRNEPFFEVVNTWDFVWPLWAESIEQCECVWQRRWVTMEYLQQMQKLKVYQNVDKVTPIDSGKFQESRSGQFSAQNLTLQGLDQSISGDDAYAYGMVELWERWEDNRLSVIANREICVRDDPNPFNHKRKPFTDWAPIPAPFQMHGIGTMRVVHDANEQLGTMRRQMLDAVTFTINPMWKVPEGFDRTKIIFKPGGLVEIAPDIEDVEPFNIPQVDIAGMLQADQMLKQEMEGTSGIQPLFGGAFQPGGSRTATGWQTIQNAAGLRPTEMIKQFADRTMAPFAKMLLEMNAQFQDDDIILNISDDPDAMEAWQSFVKVENPPKVIEVEAVMLRPRGELEPIAEVGNDKASSDQEKQQKATGFMAAITPVIGSQNNPLDMAAVVKWLAEQYDVPHKDAQAMLQQPPVQAAQAAAAAVPSGAGASGPGGENLPTGVPPGGAGISGPTQPPSPPGLGAAQ